MSKRFRFFIVLLVLAISGAFLYPTFEWYFLIPDQKIDLASGSREQVQMYAKTKAAEVSAELRAMVAQSPDKEIPAEYDFLITKAKENYKLAKKELPKVWTVEAVFAGFTGEGEFFAAVEDYYRSDLLAVKEQGNSIMQLGLDLSGGMRVQLSADRESLAERLEREPSTTDMNEAVDRAMEILTNRIDKFGVTEPSIRKQGDSQIIIEIPGAADPDRVRSFLMGKGSLNFHIVDQEISQEVQNFLNDNPQAMVTSEGKIRGTDIVPAGYIIRGYYVKDSYGIDQLQRYVVIRQDAGLDGGRIQEATVGSHPITGKPVINFRLDREGGDIFFKLTSENEGETLAIVLDDKVKAMARISEPIRESVQMTGFDRQEANDLALVLRTAAMPVDLIVENQQAIGAALGEDSIAEGLMAITIGFIAVIVFMLVYYKGAGLVSDLALVLNLIFIVAILSAFNLTLTLTSIAGLILTVGMAVDANVIIFERIKEEYRIGKSADAAVKAGFRKAFWTVMDANITTFIAAIFLSQLGSGPIQGFAYTLAVGIVSSMFTALFVSRLVFDFGLETLGMKKLSIGWRK
ncbi:protein-export membrane protein SecD [Marispirochaeta aestuarii]|uniref:Protein translocase subunit SecD n=1 Tax=Marispirochaeta aestuarii TaxID=1963862 RepID=A0A1Y1RTY0_9SPIO|nr:protein translocase subunit SecD [Marispirochaeta aestuarii]ORC31201.1 protein-export membrane protein SecD [Marispirochaeta aestuarii]